MKNVNDLNKDPEKESVPEEIKAKEAQVHEIKQQIDNHNAILKDLRIVAEDQNKIKLFQEQQASDLNDIEDIKNDNEYLLTNFNVEVPDAKDSNAVDMMVDIVNDFESKTEIAKRKLDEAEEKLEKSSSSVSKLSALLNHKRETLSHQEKNLEELKRDEKGFKKITTIVKTLRSFENAYFRGSSVTPNIEPQELSEHISKKITEVSSFIRPESKSNIVQKLKSMFILKGRKCPCCEQKLSPKDAGEFENKLDAFVDELIQLDEDADKLRQSALNNYENWRGIGKFI